MLISEIDKKLIEFGEEEQVLMRKSLERPLTMHEAQELEQIFLRNEKFIDEVMNVSGWPKKSEFSKEARICAFLFVQHSRDVNSQRKALQLMQSLPKEEVSQRNIAYLEDRILIRQNFTTKYGNVSYSEGTDFNVLPLFESEITIDKCRGEIDMETVREQSQSGMRTFHKSTMIILGSTDI